MANGFRIGAVQMATPGIPKPANPYHKDFDLAALDAHVERTTQRALDLFDQAGRDGLDLICGVEDLQRVAGLIPLPLPKLDLLNRFSHRIPGPMTERIGEIARRRNLYVAACFFERAGGRHYNTCVLIDPSGKPVGKYRKVHLPPQEVCVLTPGRSWPVFPTPLGNVGVMICYDVMFSESARCLAMQGADLLLHPTLGYGWTEAIGDLQARARAVDADAAVVVAYTRRSQVIDCWGDLLADGGEADGTVVSARLDPREHRHFAEGHFHREMTGLAKIRDNLLRERTPAAYRPITRTVPAVLDGAPRLELYTAKRKAYIRRRLAEAMKAAAEGRPGTFHWQARR